MVEIENKIRFSAVGDITLGDHPMCVGFGVSSKFRKKAPVYPFEFVKEILGKSDICFGNLECTHSDIGEEKNNYHSVQMRGKRSDIAGLVEAGIGVVNVANNHSAQHGNECFWETCKNIQEEGILLCGQSESNHLVGTPATTEIKGLKIGFLGYSLRPRQYFEHNPPYTEGHREGIIRDVELLKEEVDAVVVSLHWGEEFIQNPSPKEIALARDVIDAGAQLIVGHHPHVLRGIERYKQGVIVYSLGNFVCDMVWDTTLRSSAIFQCTIGKNGVEDFDIVPVFIDDSYRPRPVYGEEEQRIRGMIDLLSKNIHEQPHDAVSLNKLDDEYKDDADRVNRGMRNKSHMFFLKNVYRYPFNILFQQLGTYVSNRISEHKA